ncbi:MAG: hypothetical protein GQ574_26645 [Crocinitomix sp.]|nr:hypothetical protein [Crocinitomix sp.]
MNQFERDRTLKEEGRDRIAAIVEIVIWVLFAVAGGFKTYYSQIFSFKLETINSNDSLFSFYSIVLNSIIIGSLVWIIPILWKIIFNVFPFENLRYYIRTRETKENDSPSSKENKLVPSAVADNSTEKQTQRLKKSLKDFESEDLLVHLCGMSGRLSRKMYGRSSAYLFIGSFIAILGIVYFSFQSVSILQNTPRNFELIIQFLPRFGALFFVEFVAFFFLKQYRITMDDFKYYESIKRQRESNLIILKLQSESMFDNDQEKLQTLIKNLSLFNNPNLLKNSETTESIENRKFSNEELNVMSNIISQIGNLKNS